MNNKATQESTYIHSSYKTYMNSKTRAKRTYAKHIPPEKMSSSWFLWAKFSFLTIQLKICRYSLWHGFLVSNDGNSVINFIYAYIWELSQKRFSEQKLKFSVLILYILWNLWILQPVWSILCSSHHFSRSCFFLWKSMLITIIPWIWF